MTHTVIVLEKMMSRADYWAYLIAELGFESERGRPLLFALGAVEEFADMLADAIARDALARAGAAPEDDAL